MTDIKIESLDVKRRMCSGCHVEKDVSEFFFKNRDHKQCETCSQRRKKKSKDKEQCEICGKRASFNYEDEKKGIRCKKHIVEKMINVKRRSGCCIKCRIARANFNFEGQTKQLYCSLCKEKGMTSVKGKKCQNCNLKFPSYNYIGETKSIFCFDCKDEKMINVKSKKCIICNIKVPTCNYIGEKAAFCSDCKTNNMVDVNKRCIVCNIKYPYYGLPGGKRKYCIICKTDDMINMCYKKCEVCDIKIPTYGYIGKKPTHCFLCKLDDMKHTRYTKCIICNLKMPTCNYIGQKAAFCSDCKLENMFDVKNKKCIVCKLKCPVYNHIGGKRRYCFDCKTDDMVNITNKLCSFPDCKIRPSYGFPLSTKTRCTSHKDPGMISNPKRKCDDCTKLALYGFNKAEHCEAHKKPNEIDHTLRQCKKCSNIDIVNSDGICINFCLATDKFYNIYKKTSRRKEKEIKKYLEENLDKKMYSYDKVLDSKCNLRRPDIVYDAGTHFVVIEIDEHQHKRESYTPECEINRMKEILQSSDGRGVVFIRYNPDPFKVNGKTSKMRHVKRKEMLLFHVNLAFISPPKSPEELCRVIYLFYDDYNKKNTQYTNIIIPF